MITCPKPYSIYLSITIGSRANWLVIHACFGVPWKKYPKVWIAEGGPFVERRLEGALGASCWHRVNGLGLTVLRLGIRVYVLKLRDQRLQDVYLKYIT